MKTPMLRPVVEALTFGFERIGMIIRIAWLPIVLVIALHVAFFGMFFNASNLVEINTSAIVDDPDTAEAAIENALRQIDPSNIGLAIPGMIGLSFLSMLIFAPVLVAATRASTLAEYEPPSLPFYFALGGRQIRYFLVQVLYGALITLIVLVFGGLALGSFAGMAVLLPAADGSIRMLIAAVGAGFGVAFAILGIWIALRFITVLPIAAVENRIDFMAAWRMTKGNFWRIVLSGLFFINMLPVATGVLFIAMIAPAAVVLLIASAVLSSVAGPGAFALVGLCVLFIIPAIVAVSSFSLAAQAAFPGRLYAYLSGCGDDCKIL